MSIIMEHRKIMDKTDYTITDDLNDCKKIANRVYKVEKNELKEFNLF